jgi:DNA-binding response OmpR family regulator
MLNNQDGMSDTGSEVIGLGTIMILEDEVLVSIVIEDLVRDMGASDVLVFADASKALEAIETAKVDLAILDVHLGNGTSFAVADVLAARGVPFMFSGALGAVEVEERHRHRPMLGKPFADEELRAHVLGLVRR